MPIRLTKKRAPTRSAEQELWAAGHDVVVGVDEVGRGAWAGPLMVGAAVLPRARRVNGVRDSKMLTEAGAREALRPGGRVVLGVGGRRRARGRSATSSAWPPRRSSPRSAPSRDSASRRTRPSSTGVWNFVGTVVPHVDRRVKADALCLSVAAASILAKVTRDRYMRQEAEHYPHWSFDTNKGYPCPVHKAALQGYGPSAIHRRTWIFMDHYVPWPGLRVIRPEQPALF